MLCIHEDAVSDLRSIRNNDAPAFGPLVALMEQLRNDKALADKLLEHDFGANRKGTVGVKQWRSVYQVVERLPVWRLRAWELEAQGLAYRVFYIYNWRQKSFHVLAIVPRNGFDYDDPQNPIRRRIAACIRREFPGI